MEPIKVVDGLTIPQGSSRNGARGSKYMPSNVLQTIFGLAVGQAVIMPPIMDGDKELDAQKHRSALRTVMANRLAEHLNRKPNVGSPEYEIGVIAADPAKEIPAGIAIKKVKELPVAAPVATAAPEATVAGPNANATS